MQLFKNISKFYGVHFVERRREARVVTGIGHPEVFVTLSMRRVDLQQFTEERNVRNGGTRLQPEHARNAPEARRCQQAQRQLALRGSGLELQTVTNRFDLQKNKTQRNGFTNSELRLIET